MADNTFDTVAELERVARFGETMLALCTDHADRLPLRAAEISAWSPLDHLAHIGLANELVIKNVVSLAAQKGLLVQEGLDARPEALAVLREGRIPRGRATAPRMVRPPEVSVLADVTMWHRDNQAALAALLAGGSRFEPASFSIPHQLLGPLGVAHWARFGAVHTHHHLEIALEILRGTAPHATELPELARIDPVD